MLSRCGIVSVSASRNHVIAIHSRWLPLIFPLHLCQFLITPVASRFCRINSNGPFIAAGFIGQQVDRTILCHFETKLFAWLTLKPFGRILAKAFHSQIFNASNVFRETDLKRKPITQKKHTRNLTFVA